MTARFFGWKIFLGNRRYGAVLEWQKRMVRYREAGSIRDTLFYVEHPDVITLGRHLPAESVAALQQAALASGAEFHIVSRGGGLTYHGPGQLVIYPIFHLARRGRDLHEFIHRLEEGIIRAFSTFGLDCCRRPPYTGVWAGEHKIASIGVAVSRWITYHGAAVNLTSDLERFKAIRPCGLPPEVMTSARRELGRDIPLKEFADRMTTAYGELFETDFQEIDLDELAEIARLEESTQSL